MVKIARGRSPADVIAELFPETPSERMSPVARRAEREGVASLLRDWGESFRPREVPSTAEWCAETLRLPSKDSARGTRFDLDAFPYAREVLDASDDEDVEQIVLPWATQVGKSVTLRALLSAHAQLKRLAALLVGPDRDHVYEIQDLIYELADASRFRDLPESHRRNRRHIDLGWARVYLGWSGNTQTVSGHPLPLVVVTELDHCRVPSREAAIERLVLSRGKQWRRAKVLFESSPTDEASAIWNLYKLSDCRAWWCCCPVCNWWQPLRFFVHRDGEFEGRGGVVGFLDKSGSVLPADTAKRDAHYVCEQGCRIEQDRKREFCRSGRSVPDGQRIDRRGRLVGKSKRSKRIWGLQLSSLAAEAVSWGDMAAAYCDNRESGSITEFLNNWLGVIERRTRKIPTWHALGDRLSGWHARGQVPPASLFLTGAGDVQTDRVYWSIRAWGEAMSSWLIDWGEIFQSLGESGDPISDSDLAALDELVIARRFALAAPNPLGREDLGVRVTGVDSQFRTFAVHTFTRARRAHNVRALAGSDTLKGANFRRSVVEKNVRTGKPYPGGLERWEINVSAYKSELLGKFEAELDQPGEFRLPNGMRQQRGGEDYLRQVTNEAPTLVGKPGRRARVEWRVKDESRGNHFWDLEVYHAALADMVTGGRRAKLVEWARSVEKHAPGRPAVGRLVDTVR